MKRLRVDEPLKEVAAAAGSSGSSPILYHHHHHQLHHTHGGGGGNNNQTNNTLSINTANNSSSPTAIAALNLLQSNSSQLYCGSAAVVAPITASSSAATKIVQPTLSSAAAAALEGAVTSMQSGLYQPPPPVSYGAMPSATGVPHATPKTPTNVQTTPAMSIGGGLGAASLRTSPPSSVPGMQEVVRTSSQSQPPSSQPQQQQSPGSNFQRLKVEDALSYLDQVKYKFGSTPQVYNDFLDIMKEFKSQSIDTPGVIQRVSNLFKGFPDLIVGFNTFLPPGYKIEVQKSDQGYAFQVSVSMPSPTSGSITSDPQQQQKMIMRGSGTISMSPAMPPSMAAQCQPLSLTQHGGPPQPSVQTVPPPPPAVQLAQQSQQAIVAPSQQQNIPVVHHSSNYGGGGAGVGGVVGGVGGLGTGGATYNNSLTLSAAQVAVSQALQGHTEQPQNQPVQFNHAINYVNKIKNRFQDQPEKYKRFLDILHIYQKEQRTMKESSGGGVGSCLSSGGGVGGGGGGIKHLTEQEVYSQVAKLFENQSDLLAEFGQFLPDATSHVNSPAPMVDHASVVKKPPAKQQQQPSLYHHRESIIERPPSSQHKPGHLASGGGGGGAGGGHQLKRSPPYAPLMHHRDAPPPKKHKMSSSSCRDVTTAEAGKYATLNDYAFFDKVRKAVRTQDVYNNFLRCLVLFNQEIISKSELLMVVTPFLGKFPELMRWFREFLGQNEIEPIPYNVTRTERPQGDAALEIDLTTAKRLGASYCVIPPSQEGMTCSGRTQLCKEVLNDQWVSFPTWSEDSTFVSSRKTQYEEYMYRCEDERFELDVVIETNASTIRVLEGLHKKLNRMSADEVAKYRLDDCLSGSSPTLHQRALKRIYGDKSQDIIDGLKRNPAVAVPVVLRRLKAKEEEWREAQKGFNKIWREQNEKYYLKSLDHQGINFKQTDVKALRSKSLFNEIETLFDERHEQNEEGSEPITGPHLVLPYRDRTILDDAANLLVHHVKRQTGIQKGEKRRIKHLLRQFIPELFFHPKQQLTDDEREDDDDKEDGDESPNNSPTSNSAKKRDSPGGKSPANVDGDVDTKTEPDAKEDDVKVPLHAQTSDPDEAYTLFMANHNWYIFLRLHAVLCERLAKIYQRAVVLAAEEAKCRTSRKESTAVALRLKPKPQIEVEDYYVAFLDMVKNLLDGNMDANAYEDTLREMFGIHAYTAFTLDKVVSNAVRQLQHCVTERTAIACTDLFAKEQKRGATGGACVTAHKRAHLELAYQRNGEKAVQDENCFKIYIYKNECRMTIELLDTDTEDTKKVDEAKKWSTYKESYANITNVGGGGGGRSGGGGNGGGNKARSPVYLNRNLSLHKKRLALQNKQDKEKKRIPSSGGSSSSRQGGGGGESSGGEEPQEKKNEMESREANKSDEEMLNELDKKLKERQPPERHQTEHPGYEVSDDTECKFNSQDSKIMFTVNKDSFIYKKCAFSQARKTHPAITKRLSNRFRAWLKRWTSANVSDIQHKQCTDWLMGRGDGVVPNRTRVLTDNDLSRTPYVPYNRYRVERLDEDST